MFCWKDSIHRLLKYLNLPSAKVALLIGNSEYKNLKPSLRTPINDVKLLASSLKSLDFEVILMGNLDAIGMERVINRFFEVLSKHPDAYAIFCFIGHGFQHKTRNYMAATDCETFDDGSLEKEWFKSSICVDLLVKMAHEKKLDHLLIIVDMCLTECNSVLDDDRDYSYCGHHNPKSHILKVYSTSPYQGSHEYLNEPYGFYMKHISEHITKDKPIEQLIIDANSAFCQRKIGNYQTPHFTVLGAGPMKLRTPAKEKLGWCKLLCQTK
uniref:Mucosa-associated lymphoid tissue lymphoma translocation protein 1 n=1 Tax=Lygus hesperus TaxID=30085 RepID=A0A0A9YTP0_LYGHE